MEHLLMNDKERQRKPIFEMVKQGWMVSDDSFLITRCTENGVTYNATKD